jgi:hypothetical protein
MEYRTSLRKVALALCICGAVLGLATSLVLRAESKGAAPADPVKVSHPEARWSAN